MMFTFLWKWNCPLVQARLSAIIEQIEGFPGEKQSKPVAAETGEQLESTQLTAKLNFMQGLK